MSATDTPAARLECVTPILRVRNLAAGIDHYLRVLGFKLDWTRSKTAFRPAKQTAGSSRQKRALGMTPSGRCIAGSRRSDVTIICNSQ
jgi:hypothetical protein